MFLGNHITVFTLQCSDTIKSKLISFSLYVKSQEIVEKYRQEYFDIKLPTGIKQETKISELDLETFDLDNFIHNLYLVAN